MTISHPMDLRGLPTLSLLRRLGFRCGRLLLLGYVQFGNCYSPLCVLSRGYVSSRMGIGTLRPTTPLLVLGQEDDDLASVGFRYHDVVDAVIVEISGSDRGQLPVEGE